MRRSVLVFAGMTLAAAASFGGDGSVHRGGHAIPGRYIVVLDPSTETATVANELRNRKHARIHHEYKRGFKGLAVEISDADAQALARDPRVKFVEQDTKFAVASIPWALDRIDQRFLPLNGSYVTDATGAGVTVYVVDTGILATHEAFGGRVREGFNAVGDAVGTGDCNGHGTHVAGVLAAANYGVATSATLVPVRVLDCDGFGMLSVVLAGVDWILQDHLQSFGPAVVNISLAGDASSALDTQIDSLISAGITAVVAAGNGNFDACRLSPARVAAALTVAASTEADERAAFSNYGSCVDMFAPGTNILAPSHASSTATIVSSGTSAAAPLVAGVAALWLEKYPSATPATIAQTVVSKATLDLLGQVGVGSPNRLLYSPIDSLDESVGDSQLLADPGFEYGTTFWSTGICTTTNPAGCTPTAIEDTAESNPEYAVMNYPSRSGKKHATIGGRPATFTLTSEVVSVPSTARKAELSFYLWVVTKNSKPSADDVLSVEIRDGSGALLETLGTFTGLDSNETYTQRRFDVSRYRGTNIRITFVGVQRQGPPTWFLLDDAELNIWK